MGASFVVSFVAAFVEDDPFDKGRDKGCDKGCANDLEFRRLTAHPLEVYVFGGQDHERVQVAAGGCDD